MCDLEMTFFFCISQLSLTPQRVGSQPGLAIINSDPGANRVKCLAQGAHCHIFHLVGSGIQTNQPFSYKYMRVEFIYNYKYKYY